MKRESQRGRNRKPQHHHGRDFRSDQVMSSFQRLQRGTANEM